MKSYLYLILLILCLPQVNAQDWEKRHSFAKTYFGIDNYIATNLANGSFLNANNEVVSFQKHGFITPSINIGATHFWGHSDFFISINTTDIKFGEDKIENSYRLGTFTGLRVYPIASKEQSIRPYIGYKFSPFRYTQKDLNNDQFKFTQVKSIVDIGLGIQLSKFYFTLEYGRVINPDFDIYLSREVISQDQFPEHLFQIGVNYMMETTKGANNQLSKQANDQFSASNKWGLFFGIGPSASFPIKSSNYVTDKYPFLDDKTFPVIYPDIAVGYHFTKLDFISALSFRPISQTRSAYGIEQKIKRHSINMETYKFIADYHGFVPYIGLGLSYEKLSFSEKDNGHETSSFNTNEFSPNLVFGWDIRPSVKGDGWVLRTNLRYYPFLELEHQGKKLSLQHLEFNFIQFVIYPQRLKQIKKIASTY
ncbi:hypothetical protein [Flammeovirga sp. SubArs3]|uniref:hypothetical protein n=1 Tax=Flammeovirga sp. SubArs3 TaxID=2995316 RepID=UPI00248D2633|nr:hypothetical protein [Flammeovirga sp. SubArs3]